MSAMEVQQPSKREEQLLTSLQKILEAQNYKWVQEVKDGGTPLTTQALKELLVPKTVEMEATTDTKISALITMTVEPNEIVESFGKLAKFCGECSSPRRGEVARVMYPVFVHFYIYLYSREYFDQAKLLSDKFSSSFDAAQQTELSQLFSFTSVEDLLASALVNKFTEQKYCIRMSDNAFHLLMHFILVLHASFMFTVIERYLAIEVYGNIPVVATDNAKPEPKKTPTFTKVRVTQLDENKLQAKVKPVPGRASNMGDQPIPAKITPPAHLAKISEFKDALAAAEQVDPTAPSIALYRIHSTGNAVHCASLSPTKYACGFADSSIHVWSRLPSSANSSTNSHMTRIQPIGLPDNGHQALVGHSGPVYGTSFSVNEKYLISGSEDKSVRLWDLEKGTSVVQYQGHAYPVWDVSFSPIDVHFASASMDSTARLWTCDLVHPLRVFAGHSSSVNAVRFHPNGQYIATGSKDRTCRLWDIQTGLCVRLMRGGKSMVSSIAFSPDGKQLISGGADGVTGVWDLGGGEVVHEYPPPAQWTSRGPVSAIAFSSDATLMATSSHLNCVRIYNMRKCGLATENPSEDTLLSLSVSPRMSSILHLQFTHRNCLVGIAKLDNPFPSSTYPTTFN